MNDNMSVTSLRQRLLAILPDAHASRVPRLTQLLTDIVNGNIDNAELQLREMRITEPELGSSFQILAGEHITVGNSVISFGEGAQFGDITIKDVAGRDILHVNLINPTINLNTDFVTAHKFWLLSLCAVAYAPLTINDLIGLDAYIFGRIANLRIALRELTTIIGDGSESRGFSFVSLDVRNAYRQEFRVEEQGLDFHEKFVDWGKRLYQSRPKHYPMYMRKFWIRHLVETTVWRDDWSFIIKVLLELQPENKQSSVLGRQLYIQRWAQIRYSEEGNYQGYLSDLTYVWHHALEIRDVTTILYCALVLSSFNNDILTLDSNLTDEGAEAIFMAGVIDYLPSHYQIDVAQKVIRNANTIPGEWESITTQVKVLRYVSEDRRQIVLSLLSKLNQVSCIGYQNSCFSCKMCKYTKKMMRREIEYYMHDHHTEKFHSTIVQRVARLGDQGCHWITRKFIEACDVMIQGLNKYVSSDESPEIMGAFEELEARYYTNNTWRSRINLFIQGRLSKMVESATTTISSIQWRVWNQSPCVRFTAFLTSVISCFAKIGVLIRNTRSWIADNYRKAEVDRLIKSMVSSEAPSELAIPLAKALNNMSEKSVFIPTEIFDRSRAILSDYKRGFLLASLARHTSEQNLESIFDQILVISNEELRLSILANVAVYVPQSRIVKVLINVCGTQNEFWRFQTLHAFSKPLEELTRYSLEESKSLWASVLPVLSLHRRSDFLTSISAITSWMTKIIASNQLLNIVDYVEKVVSYHPYEIN